MNILADTHILIWVLLDNERLPVQARALLSDPENQVYFSAVSVWEIAMKHASHPNELPFTGGDFYGNTAQFMVHILLASCFVISPKNPRQYTKYCLCFLANLPKNLTAQSEHQNYAVL